MGWMGMTWWRRRRVGGFYLDCPLLLHLLLLLPLRLLLLPLPSAWL